MRLKWQPFVGNYYRLTNGNLETSSTIAVIAKSRGVKVAQSTISRRLIKGIRDLDELISAAPDGAAKNGAKGAAKKKEQDPEFMAALAAVNARRGKR